MRKIFFLCALCASVLTVNATEGALSGKFTINNQGDQVQFAKGNLQYDTVNAIWSFASHQWDMIGESNVNVDKLGAVIDLFGWGTGNRPTFASDDNIDYVTFVDWGTNAISNGGNTPNAWRTLTKDEWTYLHSVRLVDQAASRRGNGVANEVRGWIILPDDWVLPDGLTFVSGFDGTWTKNNYTEQQWNTMEAAGAVFLPAAGQRQLGYMNYVGTEGFYWHANLGDDEGYAWQFSFHENASSTMSSDCAFGSSVRLVCAAQGGTTDLSNTESVNTATKRIINGRLLILRNGEVYNAQGARVE